MMHAHAEAERFLGHHPMSAPESVSRTLICSVLAVEVIDFSRLPVLQQSAAKNNFNAKLARALRGVALNDRIILDTGEGVAISFIGDPHEALFVAAALQHEATDASVEPMLSLRMGIHVGRVRAASDEDGRPNVAGEGIQTALTVMTAAVAGEVLLTRAYYEVVSGLSAELAQSLISVGEREDARGGWHELYAFDAELAALQNQEEDLQMPGADVLPVASAVPLAGSARIADAFTRRPRLVTVATVGAMVAAAVLMRGQRGPDEAVASTPPPSVSALTAETADLPPIRGLPESSEPQLQSLGVSQFSEPGLPAIRVGRETPPLIARADPAPSAPNVQQMESPTETGTPASISLAIAPWGEVHVNGRMQGVTPPLQDLDLPPGRHRIEIRNNAYSPHVVVVNARPGERVRIKHKFE